MKFSVIFLFVFSVFCAAAAPAAYEKFTIDPVAASVKAGQTITLNAEIKCKDNYVLQGISAFVHRKTAPESFFAQKDIQINRHYKNDPAKVSPYDAIYFVNEILRKSITDGKFQININTTGMTPGDYAVAVRGYFTKKGAKSAYLSVFLSLNISEGDNGKFAVTPQPQLKNTAK